MSVLAGKHVVLGVTGSIAAYKAVELARRLSQAGALVDVIMTRAALEFVTRLTFRSLTHRPVAGELFDPDSELSVQHVLLAERADVVVVAPATADAIARMALGLADDLLGCTVLATTAPLVIAPAMDLHMWGNGITQQNLDRLRERGAVVVQPGAGPLASGLVGLGRLAETEEILATVSATLGRHGDLAGRRIVVTAGGTQEPIDPVRVITNRSSGKMGFALAEAARDRGASVLLIHGSVSAALPCGVERQETLTAGLMPQAVLAALEGADALVMAAAVGDYRAANAAPEKIHRSHEEVELRLVRNTDILAEAATRGRGRNGRPLVCVGFAAETQELLASAGRKLAEKGVDLMVANDVSEEGSGFGTDTNRVTLLRAGREPEVLPLLTKAEVADRILDRVVELLARLRPGTRNPEPGT